MKNNSTPPDNLARLKAALLALEKMEARLKQSELEKREPIAIIGVGCRFPGGANSPDAFMKLLLEGGDAISEVPKERWDMDALYDPDPDAPGKMYTRHGGFVDDAEMFDAAFFGIAPREAHSLDPKQRLLLEVTWEALENACIAPHTLKETSTGVFIGIGNFDYAAMQLAGAVDAYYATGSALSAAAGRISFFLGLKGPNLAVDTACSSSLVSVHLACQSLRQRECDIALTGGVNVIVSPELTINFSRARMLAVDGRCKTFDASADGYVRGEGCGMVVLKRLSDALRNGDNVLALVRGTAVNQDGHSSGLTVPSGTAQEEVIRQALKNAHILPPQVGYVEAHGTGTSLGDPIEVRALGAVYGDRPVDKPLVIGSGKTNIGHLESASGIAGLIKTALVLKHSLIPPNLHFKNPNPLISWNELPIEVPTVSRPWPSSSDRRFAAVSAFGFSGTNVHAILEEPPEEKGKSHDPESLNTGGIEGRLLTLSARSEAALKELARNYAEHIENNPSQEMAHICYTAGACRTHFSHRLSVIAESSKEFKERLQVVANHYSPSHGETPHNLFQGKASADESPVFLFTGQGAQYAGMGRSLYESEKVFRETIDRCDEILRPHLDIPLRDIIYPQGSKIGKLDETAYTQPAMFAIEYALYEQWKSWGIEPAAVIGHSVGEYVAACAAGIFSLEDGLKLISARGRLMQELPTGKMTAIFATEEQVRETLSGLESDVAIAAVNGPKLVVISGRADEVDEAKRLFEGRKFQTKNLTVSHAFHSAMMEPMLEKFRIIARKAEYWEPHTALISNVTGEQIGPELIGPDYWVRHVREKVRFAQSMTLLAKEGKRLFLEIGPQPVLSGMAGRCQGHENSLFLATLRKNRDDMEQMRESLARLYVRGADINWRGIANNEERRRLVLPTYPFSREPYGINKFYDNKVQTPLPHIPKGAELHPLLKERIISPLEQIQFRSDFTPLNPDFLEHHLVFDQVVFPAAAYLEMALAAGSILLQSHSVTIKEAKILRPLVLSHQHLSTVQLIVRQPSEKGLEFSIHSLGEESADSTVNWNLHMSGRLLKNEVPFASEDNSITNIKGKCYREVNVTERYDIYEKLGITYGAHFRGLKQLWCCDDQSFARIKAPEVTVNDERYLAHPVLLDACFQASVAALPEESIKETHLPVGVASLTINRPFDRQMWVHSKVRSIDEKSKEIEIDLSIHDEQERPVCRVEGFKIKEVARQMLLQSVKRELQEWLYEIKWKQIDIGGVAEINDSQPQGVWIVFATEEKTGEKLSAMLKEKGQHPLLVLPSQSFSKIETDQNESVVHYTVDPVKPEDFKKLLNECKSPGKQNINGILYGWDLECVRSDKGVSISDPSRGLINCVALLYMVKAVIAADPTKLPGLCILSKGVHAAGTMTKDVNIDQAPLLAMARVISHEYPHMRCTSIDLDPLSEEADIDAVGEELWRSSNESSIALREGKRYTARLIKSEKAALSKKHYQTPSSGGPVKAVLTEYGILENLKLMPLQRGEPRPDEIEIQVRATGLNFRDVLNALGMLKEFSKDMGIAHAAQMPFGFECSGTVVARGGDVKNISIGDHVIAAQATGCLADFVTLKANCAVRKPDNMSFEEGATIATTFLTASYGLNRLARIKAGDRILIHAAAGGVGQAALQLAGRAGAEVFATASPAKQNFLKNQGIKHVMNSRTLGFAEEIMAATNGEGVNIVLNSLNGEYIPKSFDVLSKGGRFVEIGKIDIWDHDQVKSYRPDVSYFSFDLNERAQEEPNLTESLFEEMMPGFSEGALTPLTYKAFPMSDMVSAFRYMAQAKHVGKVVITSERERERRALIQPHYSYLITGGTGALGLAVAGHFVDEGARHIVLAGRSTPSDEAGLKIERLEEKGAQVLFIQCDVAVEDDVKKMFAHIKNRMPTLKGIIHAAGVLDDGMIPDQTYERFERVMRPKMHGAWNLHLCSVEMDLHFFVMFSSAATVLANPGQINYAAANAYLGALAHYRRAHGLTATAIEWGPWSDAGMAASQSQSTDRAAGRGIYSMKPEEGLNRLMHIMQEDMTQVCVLDADWKRYGDFSGDHSDALLSDLLGKSDEKRENNDGESTGESVILEKIKQAASESRSEIVLSYMEEQVKRVLGYSASRQIAVDEPLMEQGFDSLLAVELRNRMSRDLDTHIDVGLLFNYPCIKDLCSYMETEVLPAHGIKREEHKPQAPVGEAKADDFDYIDDLDTEELEALVNKELS